MPYIQSSTTQSGGQDKGQNQPQQGQSFQATVVETKPGNIFTLEIGGNHLTAKTDIPLSIGQTLQLQVTATTPNVELRVISNTLKHFLGHSLTLVGKNIDISSLIQSLQSSPLPLLGNLSSKSLQSLELFQLPQSSLASLLGSGDSFKQLIDRIGLSFESLLAHGNKEQPGQSLKAALLEIAQIFKGTSEVSENAKRLLGTLELFQLAQLQFSKENILIFPLPFPFLEKGFLQVDDFHKFSKENEDAVENFSFSLHLTLTEFGNLKVDFNQNPKGIYIKFHSSSKEKSDFLQDFTDELISALTGPPILGISFSEDAGDPASEILQHLLPEGRSLVNTKA
jgi:hypothetical protein